MTPRRRIRVEVIRSTGLRLQDWQLSPELVSAANRVFNTTEFRMMLDCLRTECPANYGLPATGVTADDRVAHACKIEGYMMALNNLEAMCNQIKGETVIEATFEPEPTPLDVLKKFPEQGTQKGRATKPT